MRLEPSAKMTNQAHATQSTTKALLAITAAVLGAVVFIADTITEASLPIGVFHVVVVLVAARFCGARGILLVAAGCVSLTVLSFFLSRSAAPETVGIADLAVSIGIIGLTAGLLARQRAASADAVAAQHRVRDLVNSVNGVVWEADARTFQFTFVSQRAQDIFGYPIDRWLGEPTFWKDHIHPDDRERIVASTLKATADKRSHELEYRMIAADGRTVWLRDLVTVVVERDQATTTRGVMVDITEHRRAEYLTAQVFERSPDGISIVGRDYRYQRVNTVYERNWEKPAERIVGMRVADLLGTEAFEQTIKPHLDRCFEGEEVSYAAWFRSSLGRRHLALTYTPLRPTAEGVEAVLVISRDLTQHFLDSEALRVAQAELTHINRVMIIGQLTASIAHEVNQPITAARNNAGAALRFLDRNPRDLQEVREALGSVVEDIDRAGEIIHRIRDQIKRALPRNESVDVNDLAKEVIALTRDEMAKNGISIRTSLAKGLSPIQGDRVQLQQVVLNLVLNAIEAMSSNSDDFRELSITTEQRQEDGVLVAVGDSGPGIDPDNVESAFRSFYTTKSNGMGMGLSICRSIVDAHEGRLWVKANEPRGAVLCFTLPTAKKEP